MVLVEGTGRVGDVYIAAMLASAFILSSVNGKVACAAKWRTYGVATDEMRMRGME